MRIISGTHKGRKFSPPKNLPVRPTTDFAKEGLFNVLRNRKDIEGSSILDLCAGTGNMALEFASRGAASVLSVDAHFGCVKYINKIAAELQLDQIHAIKADLFGFVKKLHQQYDFVFADPPYQLDGVLNLPDLLFEKDCLKEDGLLILEHGRELSFDSHPRYSFSKKYGNVNFTFFE